MKKIMLMAAAAYIFNIPSGFNIFHSKSLYPGARGDEVAFKEAQKIDNGPMAQEFLLQLKRKVVRNYKITDIDIRNLNDAVGVLANDNKTGKISGTELNKIMENIEAVLLVTRDNNIRKPLEELKKELITSASDSYQPGLVPRLTSGTITNNVLFIQGLEPFRDLQILDLGYNVNAMFKPDTYPATRLYSYGSAPDELALSIAKATYYQTIKDTNKAKEEGKKIADAFESYANGHSRGGLLGDFVQAGLCQARSTLDNCQSAKEFINKLRTGDVKGAFGSLPNSSTLKTDYANYAIPMTFKRADNVFIMNYDIPVMVQFDPNMEKIAGNLKLADPKKLGFIPVALGSVLRWGVINYTETAQTLMLDKEGNPAGPVKTDTSSPRETKTGLAYFTAGAKLSSVVGVTPTINFLLDTEVSTDGASVTFTPLTKIPEEKRQKVGWGYRPKGVPGLALVIDGATISSEFFRRIPGHEKLEEFVNRGIIQRMPINDAGISLRLRGTYKKGRAALNLEAVPFMSILNGDPQGGVNFKLSEATQLFRTGRTRLTFSGEFGATTLGYLFGGGADLKLDTRKFGMDIGADLRYYTRAARQTPIEDAVTAQIGQPFASKDAGGVLALDFRLALRF